MKDIEKTILNGTKLFCKKVDGVEGVAICFCFGAGMLQEPILKDQNGNLLPVRHLAHLVEHLCFSKKATPTHSEDERQDFYATVGYSNGSTFPDEMLLKYIVHNSLLDALFEDVGQVIAKKTITQEEVEQEKAVIKEEVFMRAKNKEKREYENFFNKNVYDDLQRSRLLGIDGLDIQKRLDSITLDEIEAFRKEKFALDNLSIFAAGNITLEKLKELTQKHLSDLPEHAKLFGTKRYDISNFHKPGTTFVDIGSNVSKIVYVFVTKQKPPRQLMKISNSILNYWWKTSTRGKGIAYSPNTDWWQIKDFTFVELSLSTSNENVPRALSEIAEFFEKQKFLANENDYQKLLRRRILNRDLDQKSLSATVDQMMELYENGNNWDGAEENEAAKQIFDHSTAEDYNDFAKSILKTQPYIFIASNKQTIDKLQPHKLSEQD